MLGTSRRTFCVEGHHYALVRVEDLKPGERYEYGVELDGEAVWPPPDYEFPPPQFRTYPKRGRAADRVRLLPRGRPERAALHPHQGRGRPRPRARRAAHPRAADEGLGPRDVARPGADARRPGLRRRDLARDAGVHPLEPRHQRAAGRDRADLRGVHPPLPRVVGRAGDPLAAVHGVQRDDLRRPRRARRLEHLGGVAGGDPRHRLVGRAHRGRADVVLDLPARREPEPRRAGRGRAAREGERAGRRRRRCCASSPAAPTASAARSRWSYHRDLGRTRAGDDRLARRARARRGRPLDARRRTSGSGSRSTPAAASTTC